MAVGAGFKKRPSVSERAKTVSKRTLFVKIFLPRCFSSAIRAPARDSAPIFVRRLSDGKQESEIPPARAKVKTHRRRGAGGSAQGRGERKCRKRRVPGNQLPPKLKSVAYRALVAPVTLRFVACGALVREEGALDEGEVIDRDVDIELRTGVIFPNNPATRKQALIFPRFAVEIGKAGRSAP